MIGYYFVVLRNGDVRMRYRRHYIIQHSQNTARAAKFAGFRNRPPVLGSLLVKPFSAFWLATMALGPGLYHTRWFAIIVTTLQLWFEAFIMIEIHLKQRLGVFFFENEVGKWTL